MTGGLSKGTLLGRYIVLGQLGAGAMGFVYAAYDPELNRRVALKIMQPQSGGSAGRQARLLREAQALARLSHPNVVVVYDVGSVGDRMFLAMELVEGDTLSDWLKQPRTWREIVGAFVAAGRGLGAAHAAGVIHRDFKPGNVMVATDGRVRVMDFGLARAGDDSEGRHELGSGRDALAEDLTQTGGLLGTPRYMPPEAYRGELVGEAGDQFSFCVALYDTLYNQRPFDTNRPLTDDARWQVREPPRTTQVPRRIHELIVKGLAQDPRARHPSVQALVDALEHDPSVRRRRAAAALGIATLAASSIALAWFTGDDIPAPCRGVEQKLAGFWDAPRKEALRRAFVAANAADTVTRVTVLLDGYARAWAAMHTESCEATRVRREQSEEVLTLRMICLERRRTDFAALVSVLEDAKPERVSRAVQSAHELPPLERCADVAALRAPIPPPENSVTRGRVDQLYQELARARAARDHAGLANVAAAARTLAWPPLIAEAELAHAQALARDASAAAAHDVFERALLAALRANDERALADAMRGQVEVLPSARLAADAPPILARLDALTNRLGDDALTSRALIAAARIEQRLDHVPRAIELAKRAIAICERRFGPLSLQSAEAHESLSRILHRVGRTAEAEPHARRALDGKRLALGSRHADLISALTRMSAVAGANDRQQEAYELMHEATVVTEAVFGPEHRQLAIALLNESALLAAMRRFPEAIALADRMRRVRAKAGSPSEDWVVMDHLAYADLMLKTGRDDRAVDELAGALAIANRGSVENDVYAGVVVGMLSTLASAQSRLGRHREAKATLARLMDLPEGTTATTRTRRVDALTEVCKWHLVHGDARVALRSIDEATRVGDRAATKPERWAIEIPTCRGRSYLALRRYDAARAELERGMERVGPPTRARGAGIKFALARAVVGSRGDRQRAVALAREALADRDRYPTAPHDYPTVAEMTDWLDRQQ